MTNRRRGNARDRFVSPPPASNCNHAGKLYHTAFYGCAQYDQGLYAVVPRVAVDAGNVSTTIFTGFGQFPAYVCVEEDSLAQPVAAIVFFYT